MYLLEKYKIDWREPYQNDDTPRWRIKAYRRAVSVLEQYQLHGVFLRNAYYSDKKIENVFSDILSEYEAACKKRFNSDTTIRLKKRTIEKFLVFLESQEIRCLCELLPVHISEYVKTFIHLSRRTVATQLGDLRMFLHFIYKQEYHTKDLSGAVPRVNNSRSSDLPTIYGSFGTEIR